MINLLKRLIGYDGKDVLTNPEDPPTIGGMGNLRDTHKEYNWIARAARRVVQAVDGLPLLAWKFIALLAALSTIVQGYFAAFPRQTGAGQPAAPASYATHPGAQQNPKEPPRAKDESHSISLSQSALSAAPAQKK
ncbi:hypothetical protein [Candidatus Dactylopiibacterium carminicum]|uniref:hypothetical protein n=1 Tax=Candidatus Dactylopiibacterium carminicum TaxID=857335 RepID=UPI001140B66F|nr:hypothetical protein [Candidatus Dactylopiibacterium carminicum]